MKHGQLSSRVHEVAMSIEPRSSSALGEVLLASLFL
jgi:hypothetical protein